MAATLDYDTTIELVADLAVPLLADWSMLDVIERDTSLRRAIAVHRSPDLAPLVTVIQERYMPQAGDNPSYAQLLAGGPPILVPELTPAMLAASALDDEHLRLLRILDPTSTMFLPLSANGRVIGVLALTRCGNSPHYTAADLTLAQEFARRVAPAVESALLYAAERRARLAAERATQQLRLLAQASAALSASLDYPATLNRIAELVVPQLADLCIIDVVAEGTYTRVTTVHADPAFAPLMEQLKRYPPHLPHHPVREVERSRTPLLLDDFNQALFDQIAQGPEHIALVKQIGMRSNATFPLIARDRVLGTLTLAYTSASRRYTAADLPLLEEIALRCAQAIENARLYQEAQETLRSRDELFDMIVHDLRNPLTVIGGSAHLLERQLSKLGLMPADGPIARRIEQIARSSEQMRRMINDLVDLARIRTRQPLDLQLAPLDLTAMAQRVVSDYQHTSDQHQIVLSGTTKPVMISADSVRLGRVLENLLANAIKYSPNGGTVQVELAVSANMAQVRVRDQGIGIPAADLPHIFERFRRAANVPGQIGGTGLGLASARQIVLQHGGTIAVESTPQVGSVFIIALPLLASLPIAAESAASSANLT